MPWHEARYPRDICDDETYQQYLSGATLYRTDRSLAQARRKYELWNRPESSVHRMLICQPPAVAVDILFPCKHKSDNNAAPLSFHAGRGAIGVTAGEVFQYVVRSGKGGGERSGYFLPEPYKVNKAVMQSLRGFWTKAYTAGYDAIDAKKDCHEGDYGDSSSCSDTSSESEDEDEE
ncbi:hypothetical protein CLAFUW4_09080 [Fulvia fulva]|uniref:Uncharacterized protein n=1 Tax=Passalora fulva TaxID=5499 RepID=A0A9Q8PG28_PASFU|nr:uncharacterized protein CLAFUR5_09189 [Fulvia fulva]KAK4613244.1 hypothetical protein CLAFUR4_09086 [Fulvia fulva]KAK4615278.1 hypothetical protein CLAFUR0_09078 [Fulvia fulva]UJO21846.1 hypothetical protein CLAFUR5_09189 [Fulvia fulva]WPV20264.1 hypothetical protein CLAFUW4_09080 [Fulvia fulva]WPV35365.1 hypothetical protein CLAFUW7_09081 [Fulvia fulva]